MTSFRLHADGVRMELEDDEVTLLRGLRDELHAALSDPQLDDPVMSRLFPACAPDDDLVDAEVRSLIFDELLVARLEGLEELLDILDRGKHRGGRLRVDLDQDEPNLVLCVLNDLRLALGSRIGITTIDRNEVDEDHPAAMALAVMDHLAYMQENLIRVLDPAAVSDEY